MQMAARSSPNTEMYWSMMPQGMPTKLRSALWQSGPVPAAPCGGREQGQRRGDFQRGRGTEPDPSGTVLRISKLAGATESRRGSIPAPRRWGSRSSGGAGVSAAISATGHSADSWRSSE
jgi:hypothetical protein